MMNRNCIVKSCFLLLAIAASSAPLSAEEGISASASSPDVPVTQSILQAPAGIAGTVTDTQGEPVIGATVVVKGTTTGTVTDLEGHFSILASSRDRLQISYVGYET